MIGYSMALPFPFDETRYSDNRDNRDNNSFTDHWKVKRKQSKVRMVNPAALLEGKAGLTISVNYKTNMVTIYDGKRIVMVVSKQQIDKVING